MKMFKIEVDEEVYQALKARAEPFEDTTPNSVLRKILLGSGNDNISRPKLPAPPKLPQLSTVPIPPSHRTPRFVRPPFRDPGTRVSSAELFPKEHFTKPILEALIELGGSGSPKAILNHVFRAIRDQLRPVDLERPPNGGVRWVSRANFHRYHLLDQGLIEVPERGKWSITEKGRELVLAQEDTTDI